MQGNVSVRTALTGGLCANEPVSHPAFVGLTQNGSDGGREAAEKGSEQRGCGGEKSLRPSGGSASLSPSGNQLSLFTSTHHYLPAPFGIQMMPH